ncbi:MAG: BtrH N-terminal domain-containing protein [Acidimicrobiia bacterium]|nr:BtrH N-terminal domain-containing protein [Acidimicrobiia bacterium]
MTRNRDFKTLVRRRMEKTGERYSTARAHVLAAGGGRSGTTGLAAALDVPGLLSRINTVGGSQPDLAAARNLCVNTGLGGPEGQPISEALAFGLAGGVGFLYGVFEYGDIPTMTIVARNRSMPDPFCQALFDRLGVTTTITETTGAKKAATTLDQALADGRPALCTVGAGGLPYHGLPRDMSGMSPHVVGVVGVDPNSGRLWLDDRSPEPLPVERAAFDAARAAYRAGKHRMVVVDSVPDELDWTAVLESAVAEAVEGFDRPPVPQFKANVGLAGLTKWSTLLTGAGKKGWQTVFGSGRRAAVGLSRLYDCVNHACTSVDAGRPLFADFLDEAAEVAGRPVWNDAAGQWRAAGERWRDLSALAVGAHPNLERYAELADERARLLDTARAESTAALAERMGALHDEQQVLVNECDLAADTAAELFRSMGAVVAAIVEDETEALAGLR